MTLPKSLTTITPLSKILAGVLFVSLPFLGFYLGMEYEKIQNLQPEEVSVIPTSIPPRPSTDACDQIPDPGTCKAFFRRYYFDKKQGLCQEFIWGGCDGIVPFEKLDDCQRKCMGIGIENWKTYTNEKYGFEFKYPSSWLPPRIINKNKSVEIIFDDNLLYIKASANLSGISETASFEEYIKTISPADEGITVSEPTDYTLSGRHGKKITLIGYDYSLPTYFVFPLSINNQLGILEINFDYENPLVVNQNDVYDLNQILSTFKFTQ